MYMGDLFCLDIMSSAVIYTEFVIYNVFLASENDFKKKPYVYLCYLVN